MERNILDCFDKDGVFNTHRYFAFLYNKPANTTHLNIKVDLAKLKEKINSNYKISDKDIYEGIGLDYKESDVVDKKIYHLVYKLEDEFIGIFVEDNIKLWYSENIKQVEVDKVIKLIEECRKIEAKEPVFYMVVESQFVGYELKEFKVKKTEINISENYNDDFLSINEKIISFLNKEQQGGIVLLHGKYGTGKTTYIRHLISQTQKKVIYIPVTLFEKISDPHFLNFLAENSGSIWIIEDCENLIKTREASNSDISTLLNMGDGLLSDALNIKIVCTFNTELNNIDKALLRKGRLISRYEFKDLTIDKTKRLLNLKGINYNSDTSLTLAEIYNYLEENNTELPEKQKMGFKS